MIELEIDTTIEEIVNETGVNLKVMGVGGGGGNAVNSMIASDELRNVEFIVANTDSQALNQSSAPAKVQLGKKITKGLGAGSNPEVGRRAAEEDLGTLLDHLNNTDILFLTGGLGGGTASGALPVISKAAKELGILTVVIVTKPFSFEGKRRIKQAEDAYAVLKDTVDTLIAVPNQRLLDIVDPKISMLNAFALSNDILKQAIKGISDIITKAGHINVDFADVKTIMTGTGIAIMGTGRASGQDRARQAALKAISSPLLENASINGAKGVLLNITGNQDLGLQEIHEAASMIYDLVSPEANIILGSVIDTTMNDDISVTVIATGLDCQQTHTNLTVQAPAQSKELVQPATPAIIATPAIVDVAEPVMAEPLVQPTPVEHVLHDLETVSQAEATATEEDVMNFDLNDFDTPTFMRKKAEFQDKQEMQPPSTQE